MGVLAHSQCISCLYRCAILNNLVNDELYIRWYYYCKIIPPNDVITVSISSFFDF